MQTIPPHLHHPERLDDLLELLWSELSADLDLRIGYQGNFDYAYPELARFWQLSIINAGDPYFSARHKLKTYAIERACIDWFARLYRLEQHWGYLCACGSEANLHGAFLGRSLHPQGIYYYSDESHYSVPKAARILGLDAQRLPTHAGGELDAGALARALELHRERPAILHLNVGTTMHGAIDPIERVTELLAGHEAGSYVHCDAALAGMMLPHLPGAPQLDFSRYQIDSVSVSGHKFIGMPVPCGVFLTKREYADGRAHFSADEVDYIKSVDSTVGGTRNGLAPLFLWSALCKRGSSFAAEVEHCMRLAEQLHAQLAAKGYRPLRHRYSNTVVFDRPSAEVCDKWQLMTRDALAHVVVMQHVTLTKLQRFLADLPSAPLRESLS